MNRDDVTIEAVEDGHVTVRIRGYLTLDDVAVTEITHSPSAERDGALEIDLRVAPIDHSPPVEVVEDWPNDIEEGWPDEDVEVEYNPDDDPARWKEPYPDDVEDDDS
ncbi:hypothetical protein SAMN04487967_1888 [Natronorubrum sediminis]|uniref:Uncharacterized protein n=1 Tax=Natronorubrum sediminis TaxID=640943 RepID=A0A1H6FX88_9EURY|nr:hypothetical protein [Natronorubrum sediminis]SEH15032.1 hypothetical protein SAMN04487967_1888 [Natronorubrum sediminis]